MLKELKAATKILGQIDSILEKTELKEKWQEEKKITGRLIVEGYEIRFVIKEAEK